MDLLKEITNERRVTTRRALKYIRSLGFDVRRTPATRQWNASYRLFADSEKAKALLAMNSTIPPFVLAEELPDVENRLRITEAAL